MGTGGSVEMKIKDELDEVKDKRLIKKHSSQPQNILPTAKPRNKGDGIRQSQSLYSLNTVNSPKALVPTTIQKENELKLTKEQEIQALLRKEQKLETENNRLRVELQALNKLCQKLRVERDTATESWEDANQRAISLEQDRQKIQIHFKIFRETKESEIQALLQEKRNLEAKLYRMQAHGVATGDDHRFKTTFDATKEKPMVPESPTPPNHWWGAAESETNSLFGSYTQIRNAIVPESNESVAELKNDDGGNVVQNFAWQISPDLREGSGMLMDYSDEYINTTCLRCYITGTPDCSEEINSILTCTELDALKHQCRLEGFVLLVFTLEGIRNQVEENDHLHEILDHTINMSKLVIFVVGDQIGRFTEEEHKLLKEQNLQKNTTILYLTKGNTELPYFSGDGSLNNVINDLLSSKKNLSRRSFQSSSDVLHAAMQELYRLIRLEFGVVNTDKSSYNEVECVGDMLLDDRLEQEQLEIASMNRNLVKPVEFEKYYEKLDEFVSSPGPAPPLLLLGSHGSGKTTLIRSWLERLKSMQQNFVIFQHYVTSSTSSTADPVMAMRRLFHLIYRRLPPYFIPPSFMLSSYDASHMRVTISKWLERLSSMHNKQIILAIDSIDLIPDATMHFKWLLDPLPVGVRVIVSVGADACPTAWTQWPTVHLDILSTSSIQQMMTEVLGPHRSGSYRTWENEISAHSRTSLTGVPLYVSLMLKVLSSAQITNKKNLIKLCLKTHSCEDLYAVLLNHIEDECQRFKATLKSSLHVILKIVVYSRSGITEEEIMGILGDLCWDDWMLMRILLIRYCILTERAGCLHSYNFLVESVLKSRFNDAKSLKQSVSLLTKYLIRKSLPQYRRTSILLPWLASMAERKKDLKAYLLHPHMFFNLYLSGRAGEIIHYWQLIGEDKPGIVKHYKILLSSLHSGRDIMNPNPVFLKEDGVMALDPLMVSNIYEAAGRFFRDLSVMDVAVNCLERSMEIRESELDPDHHLVANSLHYLGSVYTKWKKYPMAETLLKHALELVECDVGKEHPRIIQELQALCFVMRKEDRHDEADIISKRITSLRDQGGGLLFSSTRFIRLQRQSARLEELSTEDESIGIAHVMNDLGALFYVQKNYGSAELFLTRSLAIRTKFLGENHADVAQCFHNLSAVYNEQKDFTKALGCAQKCLHIRKEVFGLNAPIIIPTLKHLAILSKKAQDFEEARFAYKELLDISIMLYGDDSSVAATAMVNLAVVECQLGNHKAALPLYEQALVVYQNRMGESSKEVADTLKNIARLKYDNKQFEEAAAVYKRSLVIKEKLKMETKKSGRA